MTVISILPDAIAIVDDVVWNIFLTANGVEWSSDSTPETFFLPGGSIAGAFYYLDNYDFLDGEVISSDTNDFWDEDEDWDFGDEESYEDSLSDSEADGMALAGIGWGTDEDYGYTECEYC